MRRTMHYIVAMAAALWMAIPQVKAQTLEENLDPGIMYFLRGDEMNINFEEANEWKITFTDTDTLGYTYESPVGIILEGGLNGDSMYVPMQTIDSVVMYQPEPVVKSDVFVITREYFPYIVGRERSMKIRFAADIPLPMPKVGQKVVCNIFEEPLRNGFVGTVDSIYTKGNEIVLVRRKNIGSLDRYYDALLYSGGGAYTAEQDSAISKVSQVYRVRRGVAVRKALEWEIGYTKDGVNFESKWEPDGIEREFGPVTYKLEGSLGFTTSVKVNSSVTNLSAAKIGVTMEYGVKGELAQTITAEGSKKFSPPGLGVAKEFEAPFAIEGEFGAGMYIDMSAKAEFVAKGELDAKTTLELELNKFDLKHSIKAEPINKAFKWGMEATMDGKFEVVIGVDGEIDLAGIAGAEFGLGAIYPEITGKLKSWRSSEENYNFNTITPAELQAHYETFDEGNLIEQGMGVYYNLGAGINDLEYEYNASEIVKEDDEEGIRDSLFNKQVYHRLDIICNYFTKISNFDVTQCPSWEPMKKVIERRHIIIHHGSRDVNGNRIKLAPYEVTQAHELANKFINEGRFPYGRRHFLS